MRYKILVLLTFVLLGCENETEQIENLLSKEQMIGILIDVHILEGKIDKLSISRDSGSLIFNTFEREIFEKHKVSKEEYIRSYQYYLEEVLPMNEIYEVVVDSLNFMQKSEDAKRQQGVEEKANKPQKTKVNPRTIPKSPSNATINQN